MQQLLPPSLVRDSRTFEKISERLKTVKNLSRTLEVYLKSTQTVYLNFADEVRVCCENFEDDCVKSNLYSSNICDQILMFSRLFREINCNIHENAEVALVHMRKFKHDETDRLFGIFETHIDQLTSRLKQYCGYVDSVARNELKSYNDAVLSLDNSLKELKAYINPLIFYNVDTSKQLSKELQRKYRRATEKETTLKTRFEQLVGQKRVVQNELNLAKGSTILVLKHHMSHVKGLIKHLIESYVWEKIQPKQLIKGPGIQQKCESQLKKLNNSYETSFKKSNKNETELHHDVSDLTNPLDQSILNEIDADSRFFLERCEKYLRIRCSSMRYSNSLREKLQRVLQIFVKKMKALQKNFGEAARQPFGVNKIDKYKKDLRKHYGERISELFDMMIEVVDRPVKSMSKVSKTIVLRLDCINKCIEQQKQDYLSYQKEIKMVFDEHKRLKAEIEKVSTATKSNVYSQFNKSIHASYSVMKKTVIKYDKSESALHERFMQQVNSIMQTFQKQYKRISEQAVNLSKDERLTRIVDSEVLSVVNEEIKYAILYDGFFTSSTQIDFRSRIDTPTYHVTNKILTRKEDIHGTIQTRAIPLCCLSAKTPRRTQFSCHLFDGNHFIKGQLIVLSEGLEFESDSGIFSKTIRLMVPKLDILHCQQKQISSQYSNAILVTTEMGEISLANFENPDDVMGLLHSRFHKREMAVSQSGDSSSFKFDLTRGQTPVETKKRFLMSERKVHFDTSRIGGTSQTIKAVPSQLELHSLIQQWFGHSNFFSDSFTLKKQTKTEEGVNSVYQGDLAQIKVSIKEKKKVERFQNPPSLAFTFHWKIVFVESPSIASITNNLKITLELRSKKVMMKTQPIEAIKPSYFAIHFQEQVQTMILNFGKFVSKHFEKECEIQLNYQNMQDQHQKTQRDNLTVEEDFNSRDHMDNIDEAIRYSDGFMFNKKSSSDRKQHMSVINNIEANQSHPNIIESIDTDKSIEEEATHPKGTPQIWKKKYSIILFAILLSLLIMMILLISS